MNLNRLPTSLRREFRELPAPADFDALIGAHRAVYVGPPPLRAAGPLFMRALGFGGWYGKRFVVGPDGGEQPAGVNRFGDGAAARDRYPMTARIGASLVDGRRAYVIEYPPDAPAPWNRARDEFRQIDDRRLLGITVFQLPVVSMFPLAFVLEREAVAPRAAERQAAATAK